MRLNDYNWSSGNISSRISIVVCSHIISACKRFFVQSSTKCSIDHDNVLHYHTKAPPILNAISILNISLNMRLLDTSTITLTSFDGDDDIPPYAILSHTWGQGEVSFHDMLTKAASELDSKAGYSKIRSCCTLAAQEGYGYVWIDTCCIDKTSSAELSEAINSMFRWYQEAQVCYAYLADVRIFDNGPWSPDGGREFRESRWFTRGWTLQELLAPRRVVFYGCDWQEFGSKTSLKTQISLITTIQQDHMFDIDRASVVQKMSWASQRKTTRVEDIAYSLMGIFDVNMPLLYGEGRKAFTRLQHEIVKITDDESLFAWVDGGLVESGMFAQSPKAFARSKDIVQIMDGQPLYVRRAPYTVTNRGLAIEIFGRADKTKEFVTEEGFASVPLNCALCSDSKIVPSRNLQIRLEKISPDNFVRSSPQELASSLIMMDHRSSRLVYIHPFYITGDPHEIHHSFIIDTYPMLRRGYSFTTGYGFSPKQLRRFGRDEKTWKITIGERQKFVALGWGIKQDWREWALILSAFNNHVGLNIIVLSEGQNFEKEMGEYDNRQHYLSPDLGPSQVLTRAQHHEILITAILRSEPAEPGAVKKRHFVKIQFEQSKATNERGLTHLNSY